MINHKYIGQMIRDADATSLVLRDYSDNILYRIKAKTPEAAAKDFANVIDRFKQYGRVFLTAATASQEQARFKGACTWEVSLMDDGTAAPVSGATAVSTADNKALLDLTIKFEKFKMESEIDKRMRALEDKYEKKKLGGIDPMLMVGVAKMMGMKKEDIMEVMQLGAMATNGAAVQAQSAAPGMAGAPAAAQKELSLQMTEEEKNNAVVANLTELDKKIGIDKVLVLIVWLNQNPTIATGLFDLGAKINDNNKFFAMINALNTKPEALQGALSMLT